MDKLEAPFSIVFHPDEYRGCFGTHYIPSRYEVVDMNGLCVAVANCAFMASDYCLQYNKAFARQERETWEE